MAEKSDGNSEEAFKRAVKFLSYRARSEAEVRAKLTQLGFPQQITNSVLTKLRSLNLLDDRTFAINWAMGRVEGRGYGPLRVKRELRAKGVAQSLVEQIIREGFGKREGRERARQLLERKFRGQDLKDLKVLRRAVGFLQRRGYRDSVIAEVLKVPAENDS